jgi:GNAT superfamily N-acetyltransferase
LLVGFVVVLTAKLPHYGSTVAIAESLFVASQARKTGAGLALIRAAEAVAREQNSPAILFSAPSGGRLDTLMPRLGYRETNRVYMRSFYE